jgi:hypothetical protein
MFLNLVKPLRQVNYALKTYNGLLTNWDTLEALLPSESLSWLLEAVVKPLHLELKDTSLMNCDFYKLQCNPFLFN